MTRKLSRLGTVVMTAGLNAAVSSDVKKLKELTKAFTRYTSCDWGNLSESDATMNDEAFANENDRIVAKYNLSFGEIYIITEWDRSYTTLLFCDEY